MKKPTLTYFDVQGRGESIRMLFHHAGVEFVDRRVSFQEFGAFRTNTSETPSGFLPVLTLEGDKKLIQTAAILRYVANELTLYGEGNVERAIIDSLLDTMKSIHDGLVLIIFATKEEEKPAALAKLEERIKLDFKYCEFRANENGGREVFVGKKITMIDVYFVNLVDNICGFLPKIMDDFPASKKIYDATRASPNLKKYLADRK